MGQQGDEKGFEFPQQGENPYKRHRCEASREVPGPGAWVQCLVL